MCFVKSEGIFKAKRFNTTPPAHQKTNQESCFSTQIHDLKPSTYTLTIIINPKDFSKPKFNPHTSPKDISIIIAFHRFTLKIIKILLNINLYNKIYILV